MDDTPALFHLHFAVPDVPEAERTLADLGLPPYRRFGRVDGESVALDADDPVPDGFRLRLQNAQRGAVNVTLAPGSRLQFDHFGVAVSDLEAVVERAEAAGWSTRDSGGRRTFLTTPWRFRVEIVGETSAVARDLGSTETARLDRVELAVSEPEPARTELEAVLGDLPTLRVVEGDGGHAGVPRFRLAGTAFPDGRTVETDALG